MTPAEALGQVRVLAEARNDEVRDNYRAGSRVAEEVIASGQALIPTSAVLAILDAVTPDAPVTVETNAHHRVTITFEEGYPSYRFTCTAPADALCRADWSCECEQCYDTHVRNGVPAHRPHWGDPDTWHAGVFKADFCDLKDWFEGSDDTPLDGEVTVPVEATWKGDSYTFTVLTPANPERTEQEREAAVERVARVIDPDAWNLSMTEFFEEYMYDGSVLESVVRAKGLRRRRISQSIVRARAAIAAYEGREVSE